ncbi:MAG TPA: UbiA family prenyltransferase [Ktedonobacterales bacterium]|nr:UbiA family prenyltransferase [Ktedonobacterales bacterium]
MIGHKVRRKALAHLEMTRPYTMCHSGLVAIAGIELASSGQAPAWRVALAALVTICGWEAGLYAGDYYDRDIDAASKPDRAIPSGRVSPREAFATMVGLIAVGYICALALGIANLALAIFTTALGIAYSKTFKSKAILGNFDRGVLGVCAVYFGALAGGNVLRWDVLLLAALVFFHDSATNLVGAIRDVDGDRAAGCPTVPVVYGLATAVDIVVSLVVSWVVAGIALAALVRPAGLAVALLLCALAIAAYVYAPLWWARRRVTRTQALAAHKYLVVERLVLMSGWIAVYALASVALGVLAGALLLTVGSQALLRDRYERQHIARPSLGGEHAPV